MNKMRIPKTPTKKEDIMQILTKIQGSGMILNESSQILQLLLADYSYPLYS